jgi:hypothetical protein
MYTFIKRTSPHPSLSNFDAPDRQVCSVRRPRTNTPLQALALMNDPTYVEAARHLGLRALRSAPDDAGRIIWAFRQAVGRRPSAAEVDVLERLLRDQRRAFEREPDAARRLLAVGESTPPDANPSEAAAWAVVAAAILNLDETLTKG